MSAETNRNVTRRSLLQSLARWTLLGVLGLLAGRLIARRPTGPAAIENDCVNRGLCRNCRLLDGCRSPQAAMFRQAQAEERS